MVFFDSVRRLWISGTRSLENSGGRLERSSEVIMRMVRGIIVRSV